MSQLITLL